MKPAFQRVFYAETSGCVLLNPEANGDTFGDTGVTRLKIGIPKIEDSR